MRPSKNLLPIIEDEFEITESTIEVYYGYEGDEEAQLLEIDLKHFQNYCEANDFLTMEYEEHNQATLYSREWTQTISFEELLEDISWREYLRSRLFKYCFKIIAQVEIKKAA